MMMLRARAFGIFLCGAAVALGVAIAVSAAQQAVRTGPFTAEQADNGRSLYQTTCVACHLANMKGTFEALPLAGGNFMNTWRNRTTRDLVTKIRTTMPLSSPGSLSDQDAVNLAAFILQANGATPGSQALTAETLVPIGAVATGDAPPSMQAAGESPAAAPRGGNERLGLTVTGEVKNYVPVTDAMLLKADPADWLIVRGNYQGWNHSALEQINRDNVKDLQLAWSWSMNDSTAANEPTPLVHNGTIYLVNTDNIVQALDARTGELIWENHLRPPRNVPGGNGRDAQHGHLSGQSIRGDDRCASVRAGRAHRQGRVGRRDRRQRQGLRNFQRTHRNSRQGDSGREWLRPLQGAGEGSGLLHQRVRSGNRKTALALQHDCALGRARRRHLGQFAEHAARGRGNLDHRQLRSGTQSDVLGRGAGQAMDAGEPRHAKARRCTSSSTLALRPDDGKLAWYFQHVAGETLDMDEVYERVLVDIGDRKTLFTIGKTGILWKLDRKTGEFIDARETIFQNIFTYRSCRPAS